MELSKEQIEKLTEFIEPFKSDIVSVELWGSGCLPWVEDKRDLDVVILFSNKNKILELMDYFKLSILADIFNKYHLDIHISTVDEHKKFNKGFSPYESYFSEGLLGYNKVDNFNMLEDVEAFKLRYKKLIINTLDRYPLEHFFIAKNAYKVYLVWAFVKNNKYELNKTQKANFDKVKLQEKTYLDIFSKAIEDIKAW